MIKRNELTNCMEDWISPAEAGRIWGKRQATVSRRMQRGRLTIRVFKGRKYLFRPEVAEWVDLKKGNPNLIRHVNGNAIDFDTWHVMESVMAQVASKDSDRVFQLMQHGTKPAVDVMALDDGRWERLAVRKLA